MIVRGSVYSPRLSQHDPPELVAGVQALIPDQFFSISKGLWHPVNIQVEHRARVAEQRPSGGGYSSAAPSSRGSDYCVAVCTTLRCAGKELTESMRLHLPELYPEMWVLLDTWLVIWLEQSSTERSAALMMNTGERRPVSALD
jgi:hypothetical protein